MNGNTVFILKMILALSLVTSVSIKHAHMSPVPTIQMNIGHELILSNVYHIIDEMLCISWEYIQKYIKTIQVVV